MCSTCTVRAVSPGRRRLRGPRSLSVCVSDMCGEKMCGDLPCHLLPKSCAARCWTHCNRHVHIAAAEDPFVICTEQNRTCACAAAVCGPVPLCTQCAPSSLCTGASTLVKKTLTFYELLGDVRVASPRLCDLGLSVVQSESTYNQRPRSYNRPAARVFGEFPAHRPRRTNQTKNRDARAQKSARNQRSRRSR